MASCQSCQAEVVFVPSAKTGKAMILDAKPSKAVVLVGWNDLSLAEADVTRQQAAKDRRHLSNTDDFARVIDVYTDHHATCPNAADWKGKRRASTAQLDMEDHVGRR